MEDIYLTKTKHVFELENSLLSNKIVQCMVHLQLCCWIDLCPMEAGRKHADSAAISIALDDKSKEASLHAHQKLLFMSYFFRSWLDLSALFIKRETKHVIPSQNGKLSLEVPRKSKSVPRVGMYSKRSHDCNLQLYAYTSDIPVKARVNEVACQQRTICSK